MNNAELVIPRQIGTEGDTPVILDYATLHDLQAIHELELALFPEEPWSIDMFLEEIQHETRTYCVLREGDSIIGYAGVMVVADTADVQTIAVIPEREGRGYGRLLLNTLHQLAQSRGAERILLEVRADNPRAQQLYLRNGYTQIHLRRGYYEDGQDALIMMHEFAPSASAEPDSTQDSYETNPYAAEYLHRGESHVY